MDRNIQKLQLGIQTYNWGKKGLASEISKYLVSSGQVEEKEIDSNQSYAELWVGTHTKTPSLLENGKTLAEFLKESHEALGDKILRKFGNNLPFLLKVLSIGHPLQLQIHPTKAEAKELHKKNPEAFLDGNHKPEMAIALTPFTAMCGFRVPLEILQYAQAINEFAEALGPVGMEVLKSQATDQQKIRVCYEEIFQTKRKFSKIQEKLHKRIKADEDYYRNNLGETFNILYEAFPGDPGCFGPFMLNVFKLNPGEAIWVPAGEIHAYVSGDCIEVLSCGDNVLFCGLVHPEDVSHFPPELTDPEILADIVNFAPNENARVPKSIDIDGNDCLEPPVEEFKLVQIKVSSKSSVNCSELYSGSTLFILEGFGKLATKTGPCHAFLPGQAFFIPAGLAFNISSEEGALIYRTTVGNC